MTVAAVAPGLGATADLRDRWPARKRHAWFAFIMAFLLMTFDFIDRQIVVAMFPALKVAWGLSDQQLGLLVSSVSITIALFSIPIAIAADRWSRVKSITAMAVIWSVATIACGFARNHSQLLMARSVIGFGEAGYGAAGAALLTSMFPATHRATVVGGFLAAASVGSVLGVILGGFVTARWGWQAAFGIVGVPGMILALTFLWVRDYRTVPLIDSGAVRMRMTTVVRALFKPRSAVAAYLAGACQLLAVSTLLAWLPSYFNRAYGLPVDQAGVKSALVILMGCIGIVFWGYVADRVARANPRAKMIVPAACLVATTALLSPAFGLMAPGGLQFALILLGGFMLTAASGSVPSIAIDVIHPGLRATAAAVVAVVQNLFGLAAGPFIAGWLSDSSGLGVALAVMPLFCLLAAAVLAAGSRAYPADLTRARTGELEA